MKTTLVSLFVVTLLACVNTSCSRKDSGADEEQRAAAAAEQAAIAQRRDLFGPEALAPEIKWRDNGFGYRILTEGTPPKPGLGAPVRLTYTGRLKDGTVFDRTEKPVVYQIGSTIPGLSNGLQMLGTGGKATFFIPPRLGYGSQKVMGIPPNSGLIFDVEVLAVNQ